MLLTKTNVVVFILQVMIIDKKVDENVSTFTPLEQDVHSNIKYIGMGYMPCNGYVPCQVKYF